MERMVDDPTLEIVLQQLRDFHASHAHEDADLDPLDQRGRSEVCPGSPLKEGDDVFIGEHGHATRVACAGTGREHFYACYISPEDGPWVSKYTVQQITDRAPLDPSETPMPVLPPPEEPPPEEPPV